jgi:hypothetical protein
VVEVEVEVTAPFSASISEPSALHSGRSVSIEFVPPSPVVVLPPPIPPVWDRSRSRSDSPSWRGRYAPSPTRRPAILTADESPRGRSPHRMPTIRSRSPSPRRRRPVVVQVPQDSSQGERRRGGEFSMRPTIIIEAPPPSSPPNQRVNTARDDSQDGPRRVTTFGRASWRRSRRTSPLFSSRRPSPTYAPPRPITVIQPPSSPHRAFSSARDLGTEEDIACHYIMPPQYWGRPPTPPAITHRLTRTSAPPSPPIMNEPQQSDMWAEPSPIQTLPWHSSTHLEQQSMHIVPGSAPWPSEPTYDYPAAGFYFQNQYIPAVQNAPEPMVVQVPSHPSPRVVARVVRRTTTPPLDARPAFGPSSPPAQQLCSGFVLHVPATQTAVPSRVRVSSDD